jgi:hypothetical protein
MPLPSTGDFTSPQMAQRIVDEALVLSEGFRDAFTQAISEIVESAELIQLLQDIQAGQFVGLTPGVLDIIDAVEIEPDEMLRIQREALAQAADITNQETGLDFRFDIINPRAAQAALNIGSYLVRYVNDSVRERLREIIAEQVSGLLSVADARRMIRDRVGLLPQHAVAVQNYEAGLLASGMDPTRVQTLAARYSERLLRYRAEMISRTEVARATSVGQQEYWLQARDAGRLPPNTMRIWIVNIDELTCDICRPMQDSDPIGLEDYWTTVEGDTVYYPTQSHPNCRCTTGLVFPDLMNKVDPTGYERWLMTRPVQKHAEHDQQSHGNWARGRSGKFVGTETIDQLKEMGLEGDELQEALRSVREARESGRQEVGIVASRRGGFTTLTIYDTDNIWGKEGEVDIPVPEFWVSADNAYTTWSAYEGNYQIRKMSAVMMGLDAPKAEKGNFENPLFRAEVFGVDQLDEDERADLAVHHLYAEAMVSAIADADVTSRPLYRGLGDVPADSPIRNLQPGDEFSAPVSAWSDGRGLAEQFSGSGSGGVLLVMDGPKRAWKPEEYYYGAAIGEGDPFGEEVLSQGEFRVTGSETLPDGTLQVTVEQTYTYDIGGRSREVEKASKKRKKRAIPEWVMELMAGSVRQPVQKHANHDQKSHGNWARQGQLPGIDWDGFKISDIERLKRSIGLRPGQEIWQHPVMREAFWRGEVPDDEWEAQYQVIEYVEGEWAKFGPARQIRDAAEKLLGLEEPERGDPTLDPYQESGRDASWGGGEDRVSDEEAKVMALWFLEHSGQVEGKFYRGTEASVERMNLSEGDEFDVGLLSFTSSPHTAASFGAETIFVVENPIGYQGEKLDMAVRYTDWDVDEFYNVVRTHAEKAELEDMYGEDIFVVGDLVREEVHPELFYDAFDSDLPNLDKEHLITGSYRIASIERVNPASGLRVSDMEPYATDKGEVLGVVDVVTLQPIDRDGDGIILEGTDEERFVGKAEKSRRPAWLRLFELSLGEMALASGAVEKHADHDQKSHGNWARSGPYAAQLASVSESDLDPANLRPAAAEFLRKKWVHYTDQAIGRTMGAAMMGLPNYPSEGDEAVESNLYYREGAMDAIYRGELTPLLIRDMEESGLVSPQDVALMMKDAVESDPTTGRNYRGMVVKDGSPFNASPIVKLDRGDTFSMPPSSFTPSLEVAKRFQVGGMFEPTERMAAVEEAAVYGFGWANVTFILEPGAKVSASGAILDDPGVLADDSQFVPFEVVANGEFEVRFKDYQWNDDLNMGEYIIRIRQTSTFDPFENEYVDVEPALADWEREG